MFSSIMHNFLKVVDREKICTQPKMAYLDQGYVLHILSDDDIPGPETPSMQPLVPCLKRFQEGIPKSGVKNDSSLLNSSKMLKLLQDSTALNKNHMRVSDTMSKDANGRMLGDPLYDKKMLYIPLDALRKMSASQKQYWSVKSQHMDVVLFFKVVIQRKLFQVVTPSTTTDGNIGPDAIHLLAIKEVCLLLVINFCLLGNCGLDYGSVVYGFCICEASCAALGVSPKVVIYETRGLPKKAQKALKKYSLTGPATLQTSPVQPITDFLDASEVRNLVHLNGYFKGSSNLWDKLLDSVMHHDIALCALGGLLVIYPVPKNLVLLDFQAVVEDLMAHSAVMSLVAQYLRKPPDLERLLGRVKASVQFSASLLVPFFDKKLLKREWALPVPNDIILGEDTDGYYARTLLLTGPNMGGKTLLRATCLTAILAQVIFTPSSYHAMNGSGYAGFDSTVVIVPLQPSCWVSAVDL
ncbi:dna mismatch repair protein msh7 [Fagus crenata]